MVGDELDRLLGSSTDLAELGGALAAISSSGSALRMTSDRHGAIPLYYAHDGLSWLASDDFWEVAECLGSPALDPVAGAEMLAFKYALDDRTLLTDIKEAPPASIVNLEIASQGVV